jgi:transcription elongation factor SPT5
VEVDPVYLELEGHHNQVGLVHEHPWLRSIRGLQPGVDHYLQEVSPPPFPFSSTVSDSMLTYALAPAWGGSAASGSRTPAWKADGARTAYGGAMGGGRTPAWNSGARTPYDSGSGGSGGGFDAFASGSRTPAWGATAGSRTPAWTANSNSASSAAANTGRYDAPTPGGDYSAPTPGAYPTAPTPGASGTASTPRWAENAPTPGALNAPTPGAGGGGGGLSVGGGGRLPYDAPTPAMAATPGAMGDDNPTYLDDSE